jgi:hypothetical protein
MKEPQSERTTRRLDRQFAYLEERFPRAASTIRVLRNRRWFLVRFPLAILLIAGGFLAILPVFGLWMIPVGLLLLAVDVGPLRGPISATMIRTRRRLSRWRRRRD